jgi:dynactin 1
MAMEMDEGNLVDTLPSSSSSAELAALADQQEEGLTSPSLRKSQALNRQQDYMSLSSGPSMTALSRTSADVAAMQREIDELKVKLRIAEKKREEDRERLKEAERMQIESEQFLAVKPKMTAKQQELQDQLKDLHKMEKDWTMQKEELERQIGEMTDQLEMTALDREVAEEKAEGALEELRIMTDKVEELQVDIEVLREENALFVQGPVDDKDKLSVGYIQLEKQNERLKDALVRLRDMTVESDTDQKRRISQLEKDLSAVDELQASYESVCTKLEASDALLEDLKIQLDDALGAEEMLEQLTERNLALTDKVEEMMLTIEDLESLKELNDELEETHLETEKQLQEEVDLKDLALREYEMRNESLEANLVDHENTFGQFRELVLNLQSEVESLRNEDKARDSSKGGGDDQAILNLNLKLQSSTLKSQAKTIELELGKLEARQSKDNLGIISPYLPREYFDNDKDACDSLLFFQRIASKTEIIKNIVEGNYDIAGNLVGVVEESLIKVCKMRHSLAHFIASARQISAVIQLASIPTFLKAGRMFKELISMERRIDIFIEQLREESLNEEECGKDYNRFVKLLEEFDFALLENSNEGLYSDLASKELGSIILFDLDLDTMAAALGYSKQKIASLYSDYLNQEASSNGDDPVDPLDFRSKEADMNESLFKPIQELINNIRSTKVPARKLLRRLANLYDNGEAVRMDAIAKLPGLGKLSSSLVEFSTLLVSTFSTYTNEVRVNKVAFDLKELLKYVEDATREVLGGGAVDPRDAASPWSLTIKETSQLGQTVSELLGAATEQENVMKITGAHPWIGRVEEIKVQQSENQESQRIIIKQTEDLKEMYKQTKIRDEVLQENNIKIERLSKQLQKSKEEANATNTLKGDLSEARKTIKTYEEGNSALQVELEQLQKENDRLVKEGSATAKDATATSTAGAEGAATTLPGSTVATHLRNMPSNSLETSYLVDQLEALRGAVGYLRKENNILKSKDVLGRFEAMPPLRPVLAPPSSLSEADSDSDTTKGLPKARKQAVIDDNIAVEGRKLLKEMMRLASSPRVVALPRPEESTTSRKWTRLAALPQTQFQEQSMERSRIQHRIQSLSEKIGASSIISLRV